MVALLTVWLFLGVSRERECGGQYLFVKHRPSPPLFFPAPAGESDAASAGLLTAEEMAAEARFQELIEPGGGAWRRLPLILW